MGGGTLRDMLTQKKSFEPKESLKIAKSIIEGIRYLNNLGFIHKDLKPENIMFKKKGDLSSLKIIDFGLVEKLTENFSNEGYNSVSGTPGYIAPELFQDLRFLIDSDEKMIKMDVFAIGAILFEMIFGKGLFGDKSDQILDNNRNGIKITNSEELKTNQPLISNLLNEMITLNPVKRINLEKAKLNIEAILDDFDDQSDEKILFDFEDNEPIQDIGKFILHCKLKSGLDSK